MIITEKKKYNSIIYDKNKLWDDSQNALDNKDYVSAIAFLQQFIKLEPTYIDTYPNMSYAYINMKEYVLSEKYLKMAKLNINKNEKMNSVYFLNYSYTLVGLANERIKTNNYDEAKKLYDRAIRYLGTYLSKNPNSKKAKELKNNIDDVIKSIKEYYE